MRGTTLHHDPSIQEPTEGNFADTATLGLHADTDSFVRHEFPDGLYRHQHLAIQNILGGSNTVVATRTSSGKSLIFALPVLNTMCHESNATSLFLYPQKALANDQLLKLREFASETPAVAALQSTNEHLISRYDGSTPQDSRTAVRENGQVILTNPDMLHYAMLQYHDRHWARFFANLRHVVIDECHEYRGIFGTNVAHILRRLRQVCKLHGSDPTFVATSATIHEPQTHMERLTGVDFECIGADSDGSRQGRRKFWMVSGEDHFYDYGRKLAFKLAEEGLSVLAFCPGRMAAERMMARLLSQHEDKLPHVRVYRAGLSADEREKIENGLRDKSVRLVFSTSALELGIDIGEVDAVVCIGLPNSMMSLWQRAGRAARAGKEGGIVLIPGETPIDTYYAKHPDELFAKDHEPLVLSTNNRRVVCQHYACATAEAGGDEDSLLTDVLGDEVAQVQLARSQGKLDDDVFYRADPHMHINIRSIGDGNYKLVVGKDDEVIGEIDEFHLLRESYRNAIYRHGGKAYRVKDVIRGKRKVLLDHEYSWNETSAFIQKKIRLKRRNKVADYPGTMVSTVNIDVTEFLLCATEKDRAGNVVNQWNGNLGMPTHTLPTEATLLRFRQGLWSQLTNDLGNQIAKSALQSTERLLAGLFPAVSGPCDKQDFSSASEIDADGTASIYLYDMVYDGVGLTFCAMDRIADLVDKAIERLEQCECDEDRGCFRCVANPLTGETSSKAATLTVLKLLQTEFATTPKVKQEHDQADGQFENSSDFHECTDCQSQVRSGDRFCSNCGAKQD